MRVLVRILDGDGGHRKEGKGGMRGRARKRWAGKAFDGRLEGWRAGGLGAIDGAGGGKVSGKGRAWVSIEFSIYTPYCGLPTYLSTYFFAYLRTYLLLYLLTSLLPSLLTYSLTHLLTYYDPHTRLLNC